MAIVLGTNQYGKAENRVVRIHRPGPRHEIVDLNVTTALTGDFSAAHLIGDQGQVLPTDTQKQTAYSYAKEKSTDSPEQYALALASHFVDDVDPVDTARVEVEQYAWRRIVVDGQEHPHSWVREGGAIRTAHVTVAGQAGIDGAPQQRWVVAGVKELVILKSTGSEFHGFLEDSYTVLTPTHDRMMATSLVSRWLYSPEAEAEGLDWNAAYALVLDTIAEKFATVHSLALQQTLYEMGKAVLERVPAIQEIRFSAPNKHHFDYDLARFGVENNGEVYHADDRPYGLIQASVLRDDAVSAPAAWATSASFA